jgi:hypothetical protein
LQEGEIYCGRERFIAGERVEEGREGKRAGKYKMERSGGE